MAGETDGTTSKRIDDSVEDAHSIGLVWPEDRAAVTASPDFGLEFVDGAGHHPPALDDSAPRSAGPLTDADLARVIGVSNLSTLHDAAESAPRNRRGGSRFTVSGRALASADRTTETVMLRNVSAGGISFLHAREMSPGDRFRISMRIPGGSATLDRDCAVLRCHPGGTGLALFRVAARFAA